MKKTLLTLLSLLLFAYVSAAQDFAANEVTPEEMNMKSYKNDTSAHAVVLQEYGNSRINVANDDNIKLIYEYHVKVKIFDSKGFDNGTVQIPVYNNGSGDVYESVSGITGTTYYKDDNGLTQKVDLERNKIYLVKENKHWGNYKFAMPGLRNGCVIEYKYTIESPYFENLHSWVFQSGIPKIKSEYDVHIPGFWNYNASMRGYLKLSKNTSELERTCFSSHGAVCDCSFLVYSMNDIPAFVEEDYMTSKRNFESAINYELVDYINPYNGAKYKVAKDWKDVDYEIKNEPYFGNQIKRKSLFKDKVTPLIAGKTDDLSKAKEVYAFIKKSYKWNEFYGKYSESIGKAFDAHTGSVADINLSLIAALSAAGINTEAVLLSTRDNGVVNSLYPALADFNYVIAKVNIDGKSYFLDASEPLLPFGVLPFRCLNDKGRVISLDKPSYWVDLNLPQKEKSTYALDLTLQDNGKLKGKITNYSIGYNAYKRRKEIKKFNSTDEYVENLESKLPKLKILKSNVAYVDSLDMPVLEEYEVELSIYDKVSANRLSFDPFFFNKITNNPFKLVQRSYPVDWGMSSEDRYIVTIHLPPNYIIETPPLVASASMPDNGGKFLTSYEPDNNSFTFSYVMQFNKGIYGLEEYPYLKEFYNRVIQSEKEEMVFKKK